MAKALFGHLLPVGAADPMMVAQVAQLRRRVAELEETLADVTAERDALMADGVARTLTHLQGELPAEVRLDDDFKHALA